MVSTPSPLMMVSRCVSWKAFMRIFSTTRSPACGSSPAVSSMPQMAFSVGGTTGRPSVHPLSK